MLSTYGVDILDPGVSLRRLHVLLTRLPAGAIPTRADNVAAWTIESHLLANLIDAVNLLTYVTARAYGNKPDQPRPTWRPGQSRPSRVGRMRWGELGAALSRESGVTHG
jgi:hypothetical protein